MRILDYGRLIFQAEGIMSHRRFGRFALAMFLAVAAGAGGFVWGAETPNAPKRRAAEIAIDQGFPNRWN